MCMLKFPVLFILVVAEYSANTANYHQRGYGSCTFKNNDTCGYEVNSPWIINEGSYPLSSHISLFRNGGQDDNFFAVFDIHKVSDLSSNPVFAMTSPLLPKGPACLSFYYSLPAANTTLLVRTRTEDNVTVALWNKTDRGIKNWTRVEGLVVENIEQYRLEFAARTGSNSLAGIDNINVETFRCDPRYSPVKSEVWAYCSSDGKTLPSCELQDCGVFHVLPHGDVDITNTAHGLIATLTCHLGYILNGSNTTECASNGEWYHTGQNCVPVDCGRLPTLSYGTVSSTDTTYRSTATITCQTGYSLHGNATITCNSNGIWGNVEGTCETIDCGTFERPNDSIVATTNTTYGSTATITCHIGYKLFGRNTSTCSSNGMWSNIGHLCTPVDCGRYPRPTQSRISTGPTTYNSTVIITCFPGYKLTGTGISTCGENGKWRNADQECILQTVFLKVPEANCTFEDNVTCKCENKPIGQDTNFNNTVDIPYKMNNSLHPSGQDNSCFMMIWENTLVQPKTGFALLSSTLQPGVYLIRFRHFLSAGELYIIAETGFNSSKNPTHIERDQNIMGETVVIAEDRQFRIAFRTNDSVNWHLGIDDVQILKGCDILNLTNGKITVDNDTAYFRCDEGYRLVGNSSATCTHWKWSSEAPSCELIDCGHFPTTSHGAAWSTATTYGSMATITCHTGYILNGSHTSTCGKSGLWSSTGQTCLPVECGHFYTLIYGSVSTNATTFGSIATITCHTGYSLSGGSTSTCTSNGRWSSTGQRCTLVDCGPFHPPTYSHLSTGYTTYNSTVTVTCFPGYTLTGNRISKCDGNGQWSNKDQNCVLQTVFLEVPEANCSSDDNVTCTCENSSTVQPVKEKASFDMRHENDYCYRLRWENTSVANNISFIMISSILQPGLYQIRLHQLFPSGELLVTVNTENNETYDLDMFWKYIKQDKLWTNETFTLIEEKPFRFVLRANETKDGLLGIDSIQLFKACVVLKINHGHITVDNNTAFFRCNEGYRLVGNSSSTCTKWTWNSDSPTCELIDCGSPVAPSNGHVTSSFTSYGSISTVSCSSGYFRKGIYTGVCGNNGKWSNENTTCLSINSTMSSAVYPGCSNQGWNIRVNLTLLRSLFANYKDEMHIYLGRVSCIGSEVYTYLLFDNAFQECMTQRKDLANLNIFENQMVLLFDPQNSSASNQFNWTLNVHCYAVDKNIITSISTNQLHNAEKSISISVFRDPLLRVVLPSHPLHMQSGDKVYVKVSSSVIDPEIKLLLKSCYVRPALESDSRLDSVLIENGCEVESSTHMIYVEAHEIQFMFLNYALVALREGMNIFCDVAYCNSQDHSVNCLQACSGMLRPVIIG